jgi:hypothetical protein
MKPETIEANLTWFRPTSFLRYLRCVDVKGWPLSRRISPTSFGPNVEIIGYSADSRHIKRVLYLIADKIGDAVDGIDDPAYFDDPHRKSVLLVADSIAPNAGEPYPPVEPPRLNWFCRVLKWFF